MQCNLREQKMGHDGLARKRGLIEELRGRIAQTSGLEVTALLKKQQALVKINQPGPDEIVFTHKDLARFRKSLKRLQGFPLLAVRCSFVGQCCCGFVAHPELFESKEAFVSHFSRFFAEIQLEVNIRQIQ